MAKKPAMPAETLKALKASIEKWRKNEKGDFQGIFTNTCPLCKLFYDGENPKISSSDCCHGCPVYEKTGWEDCGASPWTDAYRAHDAGPLSRQFKNAARAERIFLESLLPKEARK